MLARALVAAGMLLCTSGLLAAPSTPAAPAQGFVCHVTYGGETRRVTARANTDPYAVPPIKFGSYFLLRLVSEAGPAPAIKVYVYADDDNGPVPLHVGEHPWPVSGRRTAPGFTGWQRVYEPMRDGELLYWCARA